MVQDEDVLVSTGREYWETAFLIIVRFGGLGVGVDNFGEDVVGVLLLIGMGVVAELLILSGGSKIFLFLIKVALHREGILGKMF